MTDDTPFNLDGHKMKATKTAKHGDVNEDTIFHFVQINDFVQASYAGGTIRSGFLVGILDGATLNFRYCQATKFGKLDGGVSECEVQRRHDGGIRIVERFSWESRQTSGVNVIEDT